MWPDKMTEIQAKPRLLAVPFCIVKKTREIAKWKSRNLEHSGLFYVASQLSRKGLLKVYRLNQVDLIVDTVDKEVH